MKHRSNNEPPAPGSGPRGPGELDFGNALPEIDGMGRSTFDPIWAQKEHADPRSEILHVLHGQVTIKTRNYSLTGREGDTLYIPADTPHRDVFPPDSVFELYLIQFHWLAEPLMLKHFDPVRLAKISRAGKLRIAEDLHQLYRDFAADLPYSRPMINLRLMQVIYRLCQEAALGAAPRSRAGAGFSKVRRVQIMTEAKRIIRERFDRPITLETIAAGLGISSYYLSRVFSEESGFTLSRYLTTVRMEHAAELLKDPRKNVDEVALAVGFRDSHYFRRVFKAHFQRSPKAFRARAGGGYRSSGPG